MGESKVVYYEDEETPFLVILPVPLDEVTLADFMKEINKTTAGYRYYFKTLDDDIIVKQEVKEATSHLPSYQGRIVAWVVSTEPNGQSNTGGVNGTSKPKPDYVDSDASSVISDASSVMSSEIESTTSMADSDEDHTREARQRRRRKRKKLPKPLPRYSSLSSMTDSTSSLNIITVKLDMDTISYLGISIRSSDDSSIPGIYVGQIYKGGAVDADGQISTNDIILSVNDISFENISNEEAVKILKEVAHKPGPIKLVVAKTNWDATPDLLADCPDFSDADTISLASTTLDPTAKWIQQQQQQTHGNAPGQMDYNNFNFVPNNYFSTNYSLYSTGSESPSNSQIGGDTVRGYQPSAPLSAYSQMQDVVKSMSHNNSGLEIKERTWLKVTIPDAFIGQDLVKWLKEHVSGLSDHRDARKYAGNMLRNGYINNTDFNKSEKFSDQCYYVIGTGKKVSDEVTSHMQGLSIDQSRSQHSGSNYSWGGGGSVNKPAESILSRGSGETASSSSPRSMPRGLATARPGPPPPFRGRGQPPSYQYAASVSQKSGYAPYRPQTNLTRTDSISSIGSVMSQHSMMSMGNRPLGSMAGSMAGSQASFRMALDNPLENFSDAV